MCSSCSGGGAVPCQRHTTMGTSHTSHSAIQQMSSSWYQGVMRLARQRSQSSMRRSSSSIAIRGLRRRWRGRPHSRGIAHPDLAMIGVRVDPRALENRHAHLAGAPDGGVEVVELEPQEHAVAVGAATGIAQVRVLVSIPGVELEDHLARRIDDLLVLGPAVAARGTEQALVPPATRLHVPDGDQWLRLHGVTSRAGSTTMEGEARSSLLMTTL